MSGLRDGELDAGDFRYWLAGLRAALSSGGTSDVPCGECTACCTSYQFVHVGPDEQGTLARIPTELQVPAPGLPEGHVVIGYDDQGRCPMLVDNRCSIYENRPRACRTYDCRIFAATGLKLEEEKQLISERVGRWRFAYPSEDDRAAHRAALEAGRHVQDNPDLVRGDATRRAVFALGIIDEFAGDDAGRGPSADRGGQGA
jgi:uncharacterized protein